MEEIISNLSYCMIPLTDRYGPFEEIHYSTEDHIFLVYKSTQEEELQYIAHQNMFLGFIRNEEGVLTNLQHQIALTDMNISLFHKVYCVPFFSVIIRINH